MARALCHNALYRSIQCYLMQNVVSPQTRRRYCQAAKKIIRITPKKCLIDENLKISLEGLQPSQRVTILSRVQENKAKFCAHAYYIADRRGKVDISKDEAISGGSYQGVEPMGLIWSQKQEPGQRSGMRLVKPDVTTPVLTMFHVVDGFQPVEDCLESVSRDNILDSLSCERWYMSEGIQRIDVRDGRLLATLFIPKGNGPFPGILDMYGTIGGLTEHRSALLASRGMASLALQYFNSATKFQDGMTSDIEYYEEAVDYLLSHPKVMKPQVGVIGTSQGGTQAFLLSSVCPDKVKSCVIINAAHIGNIFTQTYKGETFYPPAFHPDKGAKTEDGIAYCYLIKEALEKHNPKYNIPIERSKCKYLLIHGEDDKCVHGSAGDYTMKYLEKHGKTGHRLLKYPNTGHLIEPPHSPHFYQTYQALLGYHMLWGGEQRQHVRAQEDAWQQMLNFFRSSFAVHN